MPLILPANTLADEAYDVSYGVRYEASTMYKQTTGQSGTKKMSFSTWLKRGNLGANQWLYMTGNGSSDYSYIRFDSDDKLQVLTRVSNSDVGNYITNRTFRDPHAWYHIVVRIDTTDGTAGDRYKIYINGSEETSFATETNVTLNANVGFGSGNAYFTLGCKLDSSTNNVTTTDGFSGYFSETHIHVNQTYDSSSYGETSGDGIWRPKEVSGLTYDNGVYLDFADSGNLGDDESGDSVGDMTEAGLDATNQVTDTPTNNFSVINRLQQDASNPSTLSEGNCKVEGTNTNYSMPHSSFLVTSGKWYCEMKWTDNGSGDGNMFIGISGDAQDHVSKGNNIGAHTYGYAYAQWGGKYHAGSSSGGAGSTFAEGDIISIALDLDNLKLYFAVNGSWQGSGDPTSGATGTGAFYTVTAPASVDDGGYTFGCADNEGNGHSIVEWNFGNPSFSISSSQADDNGYGNFEYDVPAGYYALCTKNLAEFG